MSSETVVLVLSLLVGSGGLGAFAATLIKARPEAGAILINAAQDVVLIQKGTIEDLTLRVERAEQRAKEAEQRAQEAEAQVRAFDIENVELKRRIETLERRDRLRP